MPGEREAPKGGGIKLPGQIKYSYEPRPGAVESIVLCYVCEDRDEDKNWDPRKMRTKLFMKGYGSTPPGQDQGVCNRDLCKWFKFENCLYTLKENTDVWSPEIKLKDATDVGDTNEPPDDKLAPKRQGMRLAGTVYLMDVIEIHGICKFNVDTLQKVKEPVRQTHMSDATHTTDRHTCQAHIPDARVWRATTRHACLTCNAPDTHVCAANTQFGVNGSCGCAQVLDGEDWAEFDNLDNHLKGYEFLG